MENMASSLQIKVTIPPFGTLILAVLPNVLPILAADSVLFSVMETLPLKLYTRNLFSWPMTIPELNIKRDIKSNFFMCVFLMVFLVEYRLVVKFFMHPYGKGFIEINNIHSQHNDEQCIFHI